MFKFGTLLSVSTIEFFRHTPPAGEKRYRAAWSRGVQFRDWRDVSESLLAATSGRRKITNRLIF